MSSGQCATSHASSANAPAATSARTSEQQSVPRPYAGKGPQTMAQRVRSSTPPATGRQRLGQAMADFGQSAASRGLSPAVCGNQRGTIPAKPAQACGYSPTTTGGPSKTGGHRIDLKPATGKQMLKVKPDPPELPKDAYTDDFPSLSKREAANRCPLACVGAAALPPLVVCPCWAYSSVCSTGTLLVRVCAGRGQPLCPWDRGDKVVSSCWWVRACFIHPEILFQTLSHI